MDLFWIPTGLKYPSRLTCWPTPCPVPELTLVCSRGGAEIAQVIWIRSIAHHELGITEIISFISEPIFQRSFYFKKCLRPHWGHCQPAQRFQKVSLFWWHRLEVHMVLQHGDVPVPWDGTTLLQRTDFWQLLSGTLVVFFLGYHNHDFRFTVWEVIEQLYWHSSLTLSIIFYPFNTYLFSAFFSGTINFSFVHNNFSYKVEDYSKWICTFYNTMRNHHLKPRRVIKFPVFT